jgi:hypothetical protein
MGTVSIWSRSRCEGKAGRSSRQAARLPRRCPSYPSSAARLRVSATFAASGGSVAPCVASGMGPGVRAARLSCAPVPASGAAAQARKDEMRRGMAWPSGNPRAHARTQSSVASRLLPASYLFPKPDLVRIG